MYTLERLIDGEVLIKDDGSHLAACLSVEMTHDTDTDEWIAEGKSIARAGQGETPDAARESLRQIMTVYVHHLARRGGARGFFHKITRESVYITDDAAESLISEWSMLSHVERVFLDTQLPEAEESKPAYVLVAGGGRDQIIVSKDLKRVTAHIQFFVTQNRNGTWRAESAYVPWSERSESPQGAVAGLTVKLEEFIRMKMDNECAEVLLLGDKKNLRPLTVRDAEEQINDWITQKEVFVTVDIRKDEDPEGSKK